MFVRRQMPHTISKIHNEKSKMETVKERIISRKHEYDAINRIVTDSMVERAINRTPSITEIDGQLTLLNCLASDVPEYFAPLNTLHALNANLRKIHDAGAIRQPGQLARKLLNGMEQFLNTLSELALARTLIEQGYSVQLEEKFFDNKDADIFAVYQGENSYIEATGLAPTPLCAGISSRQVSETGSEDLVVAKVVRKYQSKFEVAYNNGWQEHSWVALDVSKNHEQDILISLKTFISDVWVENLTKHIRCECPHLTGVIVYSTRPNETHALISCWHHL